MPEHEHQKATDLVVTDWAISPSLPSSPGQQAVIELKTFGNSQRWLCGPGMAEAIGHKLVEVSAILKKRR